MTDRFPDDVLRDARDVHDAVYRNWVFDSTETMQEIRSQAFAAMRAVLEGHLASLACPPAGCDCGMTGTDVEAHARDCVWRIGSAELSPMPQP